jgi:hypothetical protein
LPWTGDAVLVEESDESAETLGGFRQIPGAVFGEAGAIPLDESGIHLADGRALALDPVGKLLSGAQKPLNTLWGIAFVVQGSREGIQVGSQRTLPQPGNHPWADKGLFKHGILLFLKDGLEKEKDGMSASCRGGGRGSRCSD